MTAPQSSWQNGEQAAEALGPEAGLVARLDPAGFAGSVGVVLSRAAQRPGAVGSATVRFAASLARIGPAALSRWAGREAEPPLPADPKDRRFADPAWEANPAFFALRQWYLAARRYGADLLAAGAGDPAADAKAQLVTGLVFDAFAPTNLLITNPAAVKQAFDTAGASVVRGARNFATDLARNHGQPQQVDREPFELGRNLAATPGKVVFRNELMELIQYAPQTRTVHSIPLLASPPWINKYYIMDLAPGRSFLEWAVQHERTVFAISYRNPGPSMRDVSLEDYLIEGPSHGPRRDQRHHRRQKGRHRRAVPRRRPDRDAGRLPGPHGRRPGRLAHLAQHAP